MFWPRGFSRTNRGPTDPFSALRRDIVAGDVNKFHLRQERPISFGRDLGLLFGLLAANISLPTELHRASCNASPGFGRVKIEMRPRTSIGGKKARPGGRGRIIIFRMRKWFFILLAGLGLAAPARGDAVDDLMRDAMEQHPIPGAALAIIRGGRTVQGQSWPGKSQDWTCKMKNAGILHFAFIILHFQVIPAT